MPSTRPSYWPNWETETITTTVATLLKKGTDQLAAISRSARLDAELLLGFVLGQPRTWLYARPEHAVQENLVKRYRDLLAQRETGMPVAYQTGEQEFWSMSLMVNHSVLVPRADTELLVEKTLWLLDDRSDATVLELGTGCGAITLALASERPDIHIVATDISVTALATATANLARFGYRNVKYIESDWFDNISDAQFDVIVTNPPYIANTDRHLATTGIRFEPTTALVSGADGLDAIRHIVTEAQDFLVSGGWLALEHGYNQGSTVRDLLIGNDYTQVKTYKDSGRNERVSLGCFQG